MTGRFDFDEGAARSGARRFAQVAGELTALAGDASADSADNPWSSDAIGSAFAALFGTDRSTALTNLTNFAGKVDSCGTVVTHTADLVVALDSHRKSPKPA